MMSIDVELAWGTHGSRKYYADYERTRDVITKLLELFNQYNIRATWAIVGHLFLDSCAPVNGKKHPEIIRNFKQKNDWFDVDPCSGIEQAPLWYGSDIVKKILACSVPQEIGSHSFSHIVPQESCTPECFESELVASQEQARRFGITLESFVFPQNKVKFLSVLKRHKYKIFRGPNKVWYQPLPKFFKKMAHAADNYVLSGAPAVLPRKVEGLWEIPGSYFFVHKRGWARWLPVSFRVKKCLNGLKKARDERKVFHLWFHPFNLASDASGLLGGLEEVLKKVSQMRDREEIQTLSMNELVANLS